MEQLEKDGHLLFSATTEAAGREEKQTGVTPVYFGLHHLELETGHVGGSESEQVAFSEERNPLAAYLAGQFPALVWSPSPERYREHGGFHAYRARAVS